MSELRERLGNIKPIKCYPCTHVDSIIWCPFNGTQFNGTQMICPKQIDQIIEAIKDLCWLKDEGKVSHIKFGAQVEKTIREAGWCPVKEIT